MRNYQIKSVQIAPWLSEMLDGGATFSGSLGRNRILGVADAYERVPLLFRGVRIRCNSLLNIPRHVYKLNPKTDAEGKPIREEVPWPFPVDLDWLLWRIQASVLMAGGSPVVKVGNATRRSMNGAPQDLQWLNPFTVGVRWDATLGKRVYTQSGEMVTDGKSKTWTDDEMVFIREFAPRDDIGYGTAAAMVALQSSKVAFSIPQMAAQFFENGAMPVSVLSVAENTDTEEVQRVEGFFKRLTTGIGKAYRLIAVKGDFKLTTTQNRMRDNESTPLKDEARKDIARALELPVTLLDSDETFATATVHQRTYYTDTVYPGARMIASALNRDVLNGMGLELDLALQEMSIFQEDEAERASSFATYVDKGMPPRVASALLGLSVPEDAQEAWDAMYDLALWDKGVSAAQTNLITRDEWRELLGLPAIDNAPVFVGVTVRLSDPNGGTNPVSGDQPNDTTDTPPPADGNGPPQLPSGKPKKPAPDGDTEQITDATQKTVERRQFLKLARKNTGRAAAFTFEHLDADEQTTLFAAVKVTPAYGSDGHQSILKRFDKRIAPYEKQAKEAITALLERQKDALVARLSGEAKAAPSIGSPDAFHADFAATLEKLLKAIIEGTAANVLDDLNAGIAFDVLDPRVLKFIREQAQRFAVEVNDTTWEQLKAALGEGVDAGESISQLAARIEQVMGDRITSSAETIARTETLAGYSYATQSAWEQSGVVAGKTWIATSDNRTREAHVAAHGQTVGLDEPFTVEGEELMYPGDPNGSAENIVNCRCTTIAKLKEDGGTPTKAQPIVPPAPPSTINVTVHNHPPEVKQADPAQVTVYNTPQPAPVVNMSAPQVTVHVPEQQAPVVNVKVEPQPLKLGDVHITVPDQPAPQMMVNVPAQPAPIVNVTVEPIPVQLGDTVVNIPEQPAPQVTVNIPEQAAPMVNVQIEPAPVPQPQVTVNIPEQAAPIVNVTNEVHPADTVIHETVVPAPEVTVTNENNITAQAGETKITNELVLPARHTETRVIKRDRNGFADRIHTDETYGEGQ